jgi:nucleoside-diphosphate-sugar epimerase
MMRRVAITGSSGVLGRALLEQFPDAEWLCFRGDIRDSVEVDRWVEDIGEVDSVIHLAALVPTGTVAREPRRAFETNVRGTVNVLEALRSRNTASPWIFLASSSHVYAPASGPIPEAHPRVPTGLYGLTKLQAEQWGQAYLSEFALPVCIGRIFSYSSRFQAMSYFLPAVREKIRAAPPDGSLEISGGTQMRDFATTRYIARCIAFLSRSRTTGAINIGSGRGTVLADATSMLARRMGRSDLRITAAPGGGSLVADVSRLREIGWNESVELSELIEDVASAEPSSR